VVTCTHKISKPCCTFESRASSILPWYGAQSMIQANHCPSLRACILTLLRRLTLPLIVGIHAGPSWTRAPRMKAHIAPSRRRWCQTLLDTCSTIHHRSPYHGIIVGFPPSCCSSRTSNNYDMACPFWTQYRWIFTGIPPSCCHWPDTNSYDMTHPLIWERKLV
jgi:hypothetical protein